MSRKPIALLRNITFRYPGDNFDLLRNIALEVQPGEVVMLAGPNGSGKSTVLSLLSGRLAPTSGMVQVFGMNPQLVNRTPGIGLITEPFHPEQSPLPVDFSLRRILRWMSVIDGISVDDASPLLDRLKISTTLLNRRIDSLSKGERQRIMLLIVLLRRPGLILADEPLEGLDRCSRRLIGECLHAYTGDGLRSVLWVSHHLIETIRYASRIIQIEDAQLIEQPTDRYAFRIATPEGASETITVGDLAALPGFVDKHLAENRSLHIEITQPGENAE